MNEYSIFQYNIFQVVVCRIVLMRFDNQFNVFDEFGGYDRCDLLLVLFFYVERFDFLLVFVERELYILRFIEVNYIEGLNDKKWSSRDFIWIKKLEVNICIYLRNLIIYLYYFIF